MYWQLSDSEELRKAETKAINQALVDYGADPAAVDPSRLLRLPGFKHMKYREEGRTPTVTCEYFAHWYTAEQLMAAFPSKNPTNKKRKSSRSGPGSDSTESSELTPVATAVAARYPRLWKGEWAEAPMADGTIGYPSPSEADLALAGHIARACRAAGVTRSELPEVVEKVFDQSALGQSEKWRSRPDYRDRTIAVALNGLESADIVLQGAVLTLESHGDVRNAKAFSQMAKGTFVYVATRNRWLRWDGYRWELCEKEEQVAYAKDVCREILAEASRIFAQDQERGKRLVQDAMAAHSLPRINAMLELAVSEPGMAVTDRELDSDPYLLGVANGVVDLRTGTYRANVPELYITRYCGAAYEDDIRCDRWAVFLDQIFQSDVETIESVQRLLGCTLLGLAGEEILIICFGHGCNGKSVFSNVVHKIMGSYAVTAAPSILTTRKPGDAGPRNDLASLAGARYVSINELQAGDRLDEQVVKLLAGREPISARFLHQEFFEFVPSFTPWLRTNHKPIVTGEDDGIWRRLVLLRFGRTFADHEKDPELEKKLLAERDGILLWMIEGARKYLADGLKLSPRMKAEWNTYRTESDLLGEFLADKAIKDPGGKISQHSLYTDYQLWCRDCGVRALSKKSFTQRLAERGHPEAKSGGQRFYVGLASLPRPAPLGSQGGVDRILGTFSNSPQENSLGQKTQNTTTSCPPCPETAEEGDSQNA
jgi:putative DNA primase/helicase